MSTQASAPRFLLCSAQLPIIDLTAQLHSANCGAFVCFEGWVRNEFKGQAVVKLEYSAHAALAVLEGERIAREAEQRFSVSVRAAHRTGSLLVGELAVWIGVSAGHRDAAFTACRWVIDEVKASVPIWKHETYVDRPARWRHEG